MNFVIWYRNVEQILQNAFGWTKYQPEHLLTAHPWLFFNIYHGYPQNCWEGANQIDVWRAYQEE